jgi:1-deoxy-D-xylulose-5-phosphate reductoisomerase
LGSLEFEAPDAETFPCLRLAREALVAGETAPAVLNAANEVAVAAFLDGALNFAEIPAVVERTLTTRPTPPARDLATVLEVDGEARRRAGEATRALGTGLP